MSVVCLIDDDESDDDKDAGNGCCCCCCCCFALCPDQQLQARQFLRLSLSPSLFLLLWCHGLWHQAVKPWLLPHPSHCASFCAFRRVTFLESNDTFWWHNNHNCNNSDCKCCNCCAEAAVAYKMPRGAQAIGLRGGTGREWKQTWSWTEAKEGNKWTYSICCSCGSFSAYSW